MKIEEADQHPDFPRKLLDKKTYVRIDPDTGEPQLICVEPNVTDGELETETVLVTVDEHSQMVMGREMARVFVESHGVVTLEEVSDWKRNVH